MKIFCHLLNDNSGSPRVLFSTIKALSATNQSDILFVGSQGEGVLSTCNIEIRRYWYKRSKYKVITLFSYFFSQISLFTALKRNPNAQKASLVYVNTMLPIGAMIWGRINRKTVVVHLHEVFFGNRFLTFFVMEICAICAAKIICVSRYQAKKLNLRGENVEILSNPVGDEIEINSRGHIYKPSDKFIVLMLASLREYKGINEFRQLAKLFSGKNNIRFQLVLNETEQGIKNFRQRNKNICNLEIHSTTIKPWLFYQNAHLVVNLSRVDMWVETFGMTLIEAMSFGIPVIGPPAGAPCEIISHGVDGFLIDSRDIAALSSAISALVDDPCRQMKMSSAAKSRSKDFLASNYSKKINLLVGSIDKEEKTIK